jgi:hypothetical protein
MGVDFLKSRCKPFAKGWDKARLDSAHRLSAAGRETRQEIVAKTIGPNSFREGEEVLVRVDSDGLSVLFDLRRAAVLVEPSDALISAIRDTGGYARGTIKAAYPTLDLVRVQIR